MNNKDIFESLKVISGTIYRLYRKLAYLENINQKDSDEYNETLNKIEKLSKIEDGYINYAGNIGNNMLLDLCTCAQIDMKGFKEFNGKLIHDTSYILSNKIHEKDIIDMRISYKASLEYSRKLNDSDINNIYNICNPLRDKYFIDILDNQINDKEFNDYRKLLIDAKYDYSYINSKEGIKLVNELTNSEKEMYLAGCLSELYQYGIKFSKLSKESLIYYKNRRRLLLDIDYIRANNINLTEEDILNLQLLLLSNGETGNKDGIEVFLNALELKNEDEKKINNNFVLKRKF